MSHVWKHVDRSKPTRAFFRALTLTSSTKHTMVEPKNFIEEQGWTLTAPDDEDAFVLKVDSFCWMLGMAGEAVRHSC
jgi:hypothetical protein